MFWNDIAEIKEQLKMMKRSVDELHCKTFQRAPSCQCKSSMCVKDCGVITEENEVEESKLEHLEHLIEQIQEKMEEMFFSEDECAPLNNIHDKLDRLLSDEKRLEQVQLATKTLDKFDDYMKNVDKLNGMINEMKGLVSVARACLTDKKEFEDILDLIKKFVLESQARQILFMNTIPDQNKKIDIIYNYILEQKENPKKPVRKKKAKKQPE